MNIFQANSDNPFHVSVGGVLTNKKGEVCCHFYKKNQLPIESEGKSDLYLLMRETLHTGETIVDAVHRGLMEEFGATGTIERYLGSLVTHFPLRSSKINVQKTTLYFHIQLQSIDLNLRDVDEIESKSEILWIHPARLVSILRGQGRKYERTDLDESVVIENLVKYGKS